MNTLPDAFSEVELAAAKWLSLQESGLTRAQEAELARWLAADPRHAQLLGELKQAWARLDAVRASAEPALARKLRVPGRVIRFPHAVLAAIAASIILAVIGWWMLPRRSESRFATTASTEAGLPRSLHLPDGSLVQLNTGSAVEVAFDPAGRKIRLVRGEAYFTVAKDESRPFIVIANGVAVRAVGTAFNVRLTAAAVEVLVTEGRVSVDGQGQGQPRPAVSEPPARENSVLAAGERVVVPIATTGRPAPATVAAVSAVEIRRTLAWCEPRLDFDTVPLGTIVAEFNRHNSHRLVIADPALESIRFGGTFPAADYEGLVRLLVHNYGVTAVTQGEETILRLATAHPAKPNRP